MNLADLLGLSEKKRPVEATDPVEAPPVNPYAIPATDPWAEAQRLTDRNRAVEQLAGPAKPFVEVPSDTWARIMKLLGMSGQ